MDLFDNLNYPPLDEEILILRELTKELWSYFSIEDKKKWWSIDDYFRFKSWSEKHKYYCRLVELPITNGRKFYFYSSSYVSHNYYGASYIGVSKMEIEEFINKTYPIVCPQFIYKLENWIKEELCSIEYDAYYCENKWNYCYYDEDGNHSVVEDIDDKYHKSYPDENRAIALLKVSIDIIKDRR